MSNSDGKCIIESNSDVSGIGIRVSIYILSLLSIPIAELTQSEELASSIQFSMGISGIALLTTAIIQSARHSLTLFHSICILHLLTLLGFGFSPRKYATEKVQTLVIVVFNIFTYSLGLAFMIVIWAAAAKLGPPGNCNNSTVFVVFGVNVPATSPVLRVLIVGLCSVRLLITLFATFELCTLLCPCFNRWRRNTTSTWAVQEILPITSHQNGATAAQLIGHVFICMYTIIMLELTIRRNNLHQEEKEWTFGQVMAMLMLAGPSIEIVTWALKGSNISFEEWLKEQVDRDISDLDS